MRQLRVFTWSAVCFGEAFFFRSAVRRRLRWCRFEDNFAALFASARRFALSPWRRFSYRAGTLRMPHFWAAGAQMDWLRQHKRAMRLDPARRKMVPAPQVFHRDVEPVGNRDQRIARSRDVVQRDAASPGQSPPEQPVHRLHFDRRRLARTFAAAISDGRS
jgi:hypothetical protein